jgi:hypothetical protein
MVNGYQTQDALLSLACESRVWKLGQLINTTRETDFFVEYYNESAEKLT